MPSDAYILCKLWATCTVTTNSLLTHGSWIDLMAAGPGTSRGRPWQMTLSTPQAVQDGPNHGSKGLLEVHPKAGIWGTGWLTEPQFPWSSLDHTAQQVWASLDHAPNEKRPYIIIHFLPILNTHWLKFTGVMQLLSNPMPNKNTSHSVRKYFYSVATYNYKNYIRKNTTHCLFVVGS